MHCLWIIKSQNACKGCEVQRRLFIGSLINGITAATIYGFKVGEKMFSEKSEQKMPVLFLGHGSPMNAVEENEFTQKLQRLGHTLPPPVAIVCVSAHWMTQGTWLTNMAQPQTIHDFYGFPRELFDIQYPAPGEPQLAKAISQNIYQPKIKLDESEWGLDHGTWSVLKHMYPQAQIPVIQLSLDMTQSSEYHLDLGKKLRELRHQGVLIVGSGNIVHNLQKIRWEANAKPYDWAIEFDEMVKDNILKRDYVSLMASVHQTKAAQLSVPTVDHFLPLLYILGASTEDDPVQFVYEGFQNSSISMRCVQMG